MMIKVTQAMHGPAPPHLRHPVPQRPSGPRRTLQQQLQQLLLQRPLLLLQLLLLLICGTNKRSQLTGTVASLGGLITVALHAPLLNKAPKDGLTAPPRWPVTCLRTPMLPWVRPGACTAPLTSPLTASTPGLTSLT